VLLLTMTIGTLGYMILEGWPIIDAFYMTMITLSTVGFGEIRALSDLGRIFTVLLILTGVSVVAYGISSAIEELVSGTLFERITDRQKEEVLRDLKNHYIVAGFGRVGREVANAFANENVAFVVIDSDEDSIALAKSLGYLTLQGSATEDATLLEAGIEQAQGLVAAAGLDATNVYIVLSARGLNDNLFIISRSDDEASEPKIRRAGANRVASPYTLSGRRMASMALRPHVVDFVDITFQSDILEQSLEEVVVEEGSILVNKTIGEVDLRRRTGANILAIYGADGKLLSNPTAATLLDAGTRLILLGTRDQLNVTEALARDFMKIKEQENRE